MAHFAEIDENNIVLRVLVVDDLYEDNGQEFLAETCGLGGTWVKTSYNTQLGTHLTGGTPLRKNYAGIGYIYDPERDAFYSQSPFPSWVLNEDTCAWEAPTPMPVEEGKFFIWNEESVAWEETVVGV